MRRVWFALVVLLLTASIVPACAVDLQTGWYAWFGGVYLQGFDSNTGGIYSAAWYPSSELGQFGPFLISEWRYPTTRKVAVSTYASVTPGVIFEDIGSYSGNNLRYFSVCADWETNYDANKMRLQLLRRREGSADELVWQQTASGYQRSDGIGSIWDDVILPGDKLVFRVVAVPEPTGLAALAFSMSTLLFSLRKRGA